MDVNHEVPAYEQGMQAFLAPRGADLDAVAAVFNLYRCGTDVIAAMEGETLRPLGLTHAGFVLLMTLWISGPCETRHLATAQQVSKPAIVSAVDTLVRAGLVRRVRGDADRRLVSVELTPDGRRMVARAWRAWHDHEKRIAGALTASERRTLARLLRKTRAAALAGRLARTA